MDLGGRAAKYEVDDRYGVVWVMCEVGWERLSGSRAFHRRGGRADGRRGGEDAMQSGKRKCRDDVSGVNGCA